jgi:hypothetical protein
MNIGALARKRGAKSGGGVIVFINEKRRKLMKM